jgi:hypothetical protein
MKSIPEDEAHILFESFDECWVLSRDLAAWQRKKNEATIRVEL